MTRFIVLLSCSFMLILFPAVRERRYRRMKSKEMLQTMQIATNDPIMTAPIMIFDCTDLGFLVCNRCLRRPAAVGAFVSPIDGVVMVGTCLTTTRPLPTTATPYVVILLSANSANLDWTALFKASVVKAVARRTV